MKVKYVKEVVTPADKAGKVGDVKDLDKDTAEWLEANGYVESAEQTANNQNDSDNAGGDDSSNDNANGQDAE